MQILFNGENEVLDQGTTVAGLLAKYELNPDIVTVEVNQSIIDKVKLGATLLQDGDKVEVLMFMGGGA